MTYLPRYQADEFATKTDIARLEDRFDRLDERFDRLEYRFDRLGESLNARLDEMQRTYAVTTVGSLTALTAIFSLVVTVFVG